MNRNPDRSERFEFRLAAVQKVCRVQQATIAGSETLREQGLG
jgi:hypothetical protein